MQFVGDAEAIWQKAAETYLRREVTALTFETWFKPARPQLKDGDHFILWMPDGLSRDYLTSYARLIENSLRLATSREFRLSIEVGPPPEDPPAEESAPAPVSAMDAGAALKDFSAQRPTSALNPNYTFDRFIVGPGNRFAHAACVAVASMQGARNYNPLFLYGGSGLGKTHLMQAIGNHVLREFPQKNVVYVQSEQFVNEFIRVIANKKYDQFRQKYRQADLLLIDDIQFIENKEQMQEEFFHTFNSLFEAGRNIVLTCDKPPQSLSTLEDRLRTRISSGLTIDITPPDYETRMAILDSLAQSYHIFLPDDVRDYIAGNITNNIRELEGAFNTVLAYSSLGNPITLENVRLALKDQVRPEARQLLDATTIMTMTANYYHVSVDDLKSKKRKQELVEPRHVAMYLCYELINMTYTDIGQAFGGKNHATVIHAYNKVQEEMQKDPKLQRSISELTLRLKP